MSTALAQQPTEFEKFSASIKRITERVLKDSSVITQSSAISSVRTVLHNHFESYPGAYGIRVNPKGDKEIGVIVTIDKVGKIKQRFSIPALLVSE